MVNFFYLKTFYKLRKGKFQFDSLVFLAKPNSKDYIYIQSDLLYDFPLSYQGSLLPFEKIFEGKYLALIGVIFRKCVQGEIFRSEINA